MTTAPRPAVRPGPPWSFPAARTAQLACGARLISYDIPGQHVWSVRLGVPAPLAGEPRAVEGVGTLMARLLDEGTRTHDAEEMAELLERRGLHLGAGVGERGLVVELDVTRRNLAAGIAALADVVTRPVFPEQNLRRHQRARLAEIEHDHIEPGTLAALAFAASYYDPADRLSRATAGSAETISALSREDVVAYHDRVVRPAGATFVVAGDLGGTDVAALLDEAFTDWSGAPQAVPPAPLAPRADRAGIVVVDRPDALQSELYVGCAGPDRSVPGGWAPYPVLGYLLGGSPQARIDEVLREDKGYTYGIRSGFRPRRHGGLFLTSGSVRVDATVDAVRLLLGILDDAREGFTEEEVRGGIDFLVETAPGRYAQAEDVADEAIARAMEGLTTEHTTAVLTQMRELTPKRLQRAYAERVDRCWTTVVVGPATKVAAGLEELGRGPVTVLPA